MRDDRSFPASTVLTGLTGDLFETDPDQPRAIPVGGYYSWTTPAVEITWDVTHVPPTPVLQVYRSPFGQFGMESVVYVQTLDGYTFAPGVTRVRGDVDCVKYGDDPETCSVSFESVG